MSKEITFGTIIIDLKHQFFGKQDPSAFIVSDMWSNEEYDNEVWCDHYRSHQKISYSELRNKENYLIVGKFDSSSKLTALEQCKQLKKDYITPTKQEEK